MINVSVIVPVYNAKDHLNECVDSVLEQTYTDFELLLINDGSTDGSHEICDILCKRDDRIKVIHTSNNGASNARNIGLDASKGKYIMFCDSDDVISKDSLFHFVSFLCENETVLPICSFCNTKEKLGEKSSKHPIACKNLKEYYIENGYSISGYMCDKMFCSKIIKDNNIRFRTRREKGDFNEDLLFSLEYFAFTDKVVDTGYNDYFYRPTENSLSKSTNAFYFEKYREKFNLWMDFIDCRINLLQAKEKLATEYLFHFLKSLEYVFSMPQGRYKEFRKICLSEEMQKCLKFADAGKEDRRIIHLLTQKRILPLWMLYSYIMRKRKDSKK